MSRRVNASLAEDEIAALEAHPEFRGSLGGLLRVLALRQLGQEPADSYDGHRKRRRDEKGRMMGWKTVIAKFDTAHGSVELFKDNTAEEGAASWFMGSSDMRSGLGDIVGKFYSLEEARAEYDRWEASEMAAT